MEDVWELTAKPNRNMFAFVASREQPKTGGGPQTTEDGVFRA